MVKRGRRKSLPENKNVMRITHATPIYCPGKSRVHNSALEELGCSASSEASDRVKREDGIDPGSILLAQISESAVAAILAKSGLINLHNIARETDAFEVLHHEGALYLLGNTPRGLMHAAYQLQELLAQSELIPDSLHLKGTFAIPQRIFHQRFDAWPGERADIRFISHLGASHCLVSHDWQAQRNFQQFISSPLFPDAVDADEVERNHKGLRRLLDDCADYGLGGCLWMTELPCQGGPWVPEEIRQRFLTRYSPEVLSDCGTYQGKVLCFSHPKVQAYYRDLITRFFQAFPEIETLFLFGLDSGGEFCDPDACTRCKGMSKFAQRDRLLRFLIEEGQKARPGLRVLTTSWGWEMVSAEEFLRRQKDLPADSGVFMAAECDGWQAERQSHDFLRETRHICRSKGQIFIGYDDFHWGDDTVHNVGDIQDYPLGIGAKVRRWHDLQADGVFDHWGTVNQDISCNSIALREFFLNPLAEPEAVCQNIAIRQFGQAAGSLVFQAWKELERAHAILSNHCTWPPWQWPMWYAGRAIPPTGEGWAKSRLGLELPPKKAGPITYNNGTLADQLQGVSDAWRMAFPHYEKAIALMHQAFEHSDDGPLFYAFWWSGSDTPTRREHIRRQKLYLESIAYCGLEIGLHFGLQAQYEMVDGDPERYREQAAALLKEDAEACLVAAEFFEGLRYRDWPELYRNKAAEIARYLNGLDAPYDTLSTTLPH
jgi:hypothetical protein